MSTREYWNEALETRSWSEIERWHAKRIDAMLPSLRTRSAMYAARLAPLPEDLRIAAFGDLERLPFTFKDDLRAAQAAATDAQPFGLDQSAPSGDIVQVLCSSGTTGRPLDYALTRADLERVVDAIATGWFTAGVRPDDVVAHLVGLPMVAGGLPYADGFRRIGATLCWLGGFPTERILQEMRHLRVTALLATTSFALYLSGQWQAVGAQTGVSSRLAKVLCGGEPGLGQAAIRDRIVQGLSTSHLRETMGLGDVIPLMWAECEAQDGMHFTAQGHVALELIDPASGAPLRWQDGATGELVYTTLDREATPLLRYRSRDHALVAGTSCACGRTSPRIRCIGRTDDMLIYKGMNVFPTAIRDVVTGAFGHRVEPMIRIWKSSADQVRFDDAVPLEVEASQPLEPEPCEALARAIEAEIRARLQVRVIVTVLPPGSVPRGAYKNPLVAVRPGA